MPGFSQESYNRIHGFNFETIKDNIAKIRNKLQEFRFSKRKVLIFHVYQFNVEEIEKAKQFATDLKMEFNPYYADLNDSKMRFDYVNKVMNYYDLHEISLDLFNYYYRDQLQKGIAPNNPATTSLQTQNSGRNEKDV